MTVPAPTPEPASRGRLLRRVSFAATAVALTAAFGLALSGIASTQGTLRRDGEAAAIAAQQRTADPVQRSGHRCRRGDRGRGGRGAPSRPV
jgi:hypothetical protein